jgi:hypothetical protein
MAIKNVLGSQGVVSYNVDAGAHMVLSVSELQDCDGGSIDLVVGPVIQLVDDTSGGGEAHLVDDHAILGNVIIIPSPQTNNFAVYPPTGGALYGSIAGVGAAFYNLSLGENLMLVCFDATTGGSKWMASVI